MTLIDITTPLSPSMLIYEGDPPFLIQPASQWDPENPNSCRLSHLSLGTHTGTHMDAPSHMLQDGMTIDKVDPKLFCGVAQVLDVREAGQKITASVLASALASSLASSLKRNLSPRPLKRILLRTTNETLLGKPFSPNYAHLTLDAAQFLKEQSSVGLVGIDYLSIESPTSKGFEVHKTLLGSPHPILILEGIDLRSVEKGAYELYCFPLLIKGGDGAPARALLRPVET